MAYRLDTENVLRIQKEILGNLEYWGMEGKEAEKTLAYISGVLDTVDAVIKAIKDLGGK